MVFNGMLFRDAEHFYKMRNWSFQTLDLECRIVKEIELSPPKLSSGLMASFSIELHISVRLNEDRIESSRVACRSQFQESSR